jgi:hypothetical protein
VTVTETSVNSGFGIKCLSPGGSNNYITDLVLNDVNINTAASTTWVNAGGHGPNLSFEAWQETSTRLGIRINRGTFKDAISLVDAYNSNTYTGTPTIIINGVTLDNADYTGYGIEMGIGDVEVAYCKFIGGSNAMVNWGAKFANYWKIHHNVSWGMGGFFPAAMINNVNGTSTGMTNGEIYNNTLYINNTSTATFNSQQPIVHFINLENNADMTDCDIRNNLVVRVNTQTGCEFVNQTSGGSTVSGTTVSNNLGYQMSGGIEQGITGITYGSGNTTSAPQWVGSSTFPLPFFRPTASGNLDQTGVDVGLPFVGTAPSIGAFEVNDQ